MSRLNSDFGFYGNSALSRHRQASAGLAGKFGDGWKWDVSASYGKYDQRQNYVNDTITRSLSGSGLLMSSPSKPPFSP